MGVENKKATSVKFIIYTGLSGIIELEKTFERKFKNKEIEMEKYIGVKVVKAVKCLGLNNAYVKDTQELTGKEKEGYKVVYEDGYTSWSPKDVFEKAYRLVDNLTFGLALEALKEGFAVTRSGWYNTDAKPVVKLQLPDSNSKMTKSYLYMSKNGGKDVFPLDLSCESILAEDWIITNPNTTQK